MSRLGEGGHAAQQARECDSRNDDANATGERAHGRGITLAGVSPPRSYSVRTLASTRGRSDHRSQVPGLQSYSES